MLCSGLINVLAMMPHQAVLTSLFMQGCREKQSRQLCQEQGSCLQARCMEQAAEADRAVARSGNGVAGLRAAGDVGAEQRDACGVAGVGQQAHVG